MAERKAWWEILRDQFASRGLLDPESERVQETVRALPVVKRQARGLLSLDPQAESDTALEMGLGVMPGVGQAMALRDLERARRAKDPGAAAMAASNFIPFGTLLNRFRRGPIITQALEAAPSKAAKVEPQPFGLQGYLDDDLRRVKQNFFSQYGLEEGKQFSKNYEVIELSKLKPTENTNESKIQSLMKTMREEGNAKDNPIPPIIVDSEGNILDGHHRYEAAKRLGAKYVPVVELFDKQKGPSFSE